MKLFDDKHRESIRPANHLENLYNYCDDSSLDEVNNIRILLNKWFDLYPDEEKLELKCRFKKEFDSALFELFLHELFVCQGFTVSIHPKIENTNKRPDFLVSKGDLIFYVEAKVATSKSQIDIAYENKLNTLYDAINSIKSSDFLLGINSVSLKSDKQPAIKPILKFLTNYLNEQNVDELNSQIQKGKNIRDLTMKKYTDGENIEISFYLIPISSKKNGTLPERFIGIYPCITLNDGNEQVIQSSLAKKSSRYGILDKPYLICINSLGDFFTNKYDADAAIWGTLEISFSSNPQNHDIKMNRKNDGFFFDKYGPAHKRVSGTLITRIKLGNLVNPECWLYKNPFAENPLDFDALELSYSYVENREIRTVLKKSVKEIMSSRP